MVLIFSNSKDPSTDRVIEWLIAFGVEYRRVNSEDLTDLDIPLFCDPPEGRLALMSERGLDSGRSPVKVCWYRRWNRFRLPASYSRDPLVQQFRLELRREAEVLSHFLFDGFRHLPWLTDPGKANAEEKLITLRLAKEKGLRVPKSIITNRREKLLAIFGETDEVIVKPLSDPAGFVDKKRERFHRVFAEALDRSTLKKLPRSFFPSFFQERVPKEHEVRVFYLDGRFYPTALFTSPSQSADIKLLNGLEVDDTMMNRTVLPTETERPLKQLMEGLGLNCGSVDFLVKPDGEHVFLEVNPIGQFLGYGEQANYALDRRVAEWLYQKDQENVDEEEKALVP